MLKVFLCHSSRDKEIVRDLYKQLVEDGLSVWFDEANILPGQDWDLEIKKAVRDSDAVIVCLSLSSVTRAGYVQREVRLALDVADEQPEGAIFIIPLRLDDTAVPERLQRWQWVNLQNANWRERLLLALSQRAQAVGNSWTPPWQRDVFENGGCPTCRKGRLLIDYGGDHHDGEGEFAYFHCSECGANFHSEDEVRGRRIGLPPDVCCGPEGNFVVSDANRHRFDFLHVYPR